MLQIFIDNTQLDTSGVSFNITLKSPMFSDDIEGSYIYTFGVTKTKRNKEIFDFAHRMDKPSNRFYDVSGRILFNGVVIADDVLFEVHEMTESYKIAAKIDTASFNSLIKDKSLKDDVDWGGIRNLGATSELGRQYLEDTINYQYPDRDFIVFPVAAKSFEEGATDNHRLYFNYWYDDQLVYSSISGEDATIVVPFPYLLYVIKKLFNEFGANITYWAFEEYPEFNNAVLFSIFDMTYMRSPHFGKYINSLNLKKSIPDIKITEFLKGLRHLFNLHYFFKNNGVTILFARDIINNPEYIEFSENIIAGPEKKFEAADGWELKQNTDDNDSWLKDQLGEVDISRFLGEVDSFSNLPAAYLSEFGDIYLVLDESYYYENQPNIIGVGEWIKLSPAVTYLKLPVDNKWETSFSALLNSEETDTITVQYWDFELEDYYDWPVELTWNVPRTGHERDNYPEFTPRILFYRGKYTAVPTYAPAPPEGSIIPDYDYPFASSDVYDPDGVKISDANISLNWLGEYGLYETFWKDYLEWFNNKKVKVKFKKLLTPAQIRNIDFSKKYRIDGVDYLLTEVKIPVKENAIEAATIEGYKV